MENTISIKREIKPNFMVGLSFTQCWRKSSNTMRLTSMCDRPRKSSLVSLGHNRHATNQCERVERMKNPSGMFTNRCACMTCGKIKEHLVCFLYIRPLERDLVSILFSLKYLYHVIFEVLLQFLRFAAVLNLALDMQHC